MEILPVNTITIDYLFKSAVTSGVAKAKSYIPISADASLHLLKDTLQEKRQLYAELKEQRTSNIAGRLRHLFMRVANNNTSGFKLQQLDNGLVRASNGYYALTQDTKTGAVNILWSREQKYLLGEQDSDGINRLTSSEYVYFIDSLPLEYNQPHAANSTKPIFDYHRAKTIIAEDFVKLKESAQNTSLHGGDVSELYGSLRYIEPHAQHNGKKFRSTVQIFANDKVSYSISDTSDGQWILKKYAPYARLNAAEAYVEINGTNIDDDSVLKNIFSNGFEKGIFNSQFEAFKELAALWNNDAQKNWRGENIISLEESPHTVFRTALYDATIKEIQNQENVEEGAFDSILQAGSAIKIVSAGGALVSLPTLFAAIIATGFASRKLANIFKLCLKEARWRMHGVRSVNPDIADHIAPDKANQNRIRKKLHPQFIASNRLLTMDDLPVNGITDDFEPTISAEEKDKMDRWLVTFKNKGFPTIDLVIDDYSIVNICLNGLVQFESKDPITRNKVVYSTYIESFNQNENIALPDDIRHLLDNDNVVKVEQIESEQAFTRHDVQKDNFYDEITRLLEKQTCGMEQRELVENAADCLCQIFKDGGTINDSDSLTLPNLAKLLPQQAQARLNAA